MQKFLRDNISNRCMKHKRIRIIAFLKRFVTKI
jgi:hypothetical protein